MARNPSTRWYFNDWMRDSGLRACSVGARGLWIDLLACCAAADRVGYLEINGHPYSVAEIARVTGADRRSVVRWLAELEENGVFSRDDDGTIFSRRMVRARACVKGAPQNRANPPRIEEVRAPLDSLTQYPEVREETPIAASAPDAAPLSQDQDLDQDWEGAAREVRQKAGLPDANLRAEWVKFVVRHDGQQRADWRRTWLGWALKARADLASRGPPIEEAGRATLPPALEPRKIGHSLPCSCANCSRWVDEQQQQRIAA